MPFVTLVLFLAFSPVVDTTLALGLQETKPAPSSDGSKKPAQGSKPSGGDTLPKGEPTKKAPGEPLPQELAEPLAALTAESQPARVAAMKALLESGDSRVIEPLLRTLARGKDPENSGKGADEERVVVVMGIVRTFPEQAYEAFKRTVEQGNASQREAVTFGLGHLSNPGVVDVLLGLVDAPDLAVRRAAAYALVLQARPAAILANNFVNGQGPAVPQSHVDRFSKVRRGIVDRVLAGAGPESLTDVIRKVADATAARKLMEAFRDGTSGEARKLADLLVRVQRVNRRWLGKPEPLSAARVNYRFEMNNLVAKKGKNFPVSFGASELELMRYRGLHLDRGTHLELPLDQLFVFPQSCKPELIEVDEKTARVRYEIPPRVGLTASMGSMNISYWQGKVVTAREAEVVIDTERGVPLREQLRSEGGEVLANIDYAGYEAMASGAMVPLEIHIEIVQTAKPVRHMLYDLYFQIAGPEVWLYSRGSAQEVTASGIEDRANSSLAEVSVVALPTVAEGDDGSSKQQASPPKEPDEKKPEVPKSRPRPSDQKSGGTKGQASEDQ